MLHCVWPWHTLATSSVMTRSGQEDLPSTPGMQYTRLEGLMVTREEATAILSGGGQEIERDSPPQVILVLRAEGLHV